MSHDGRASARSGRGSAHDVLDQETADSLPHEIRVDEEILQATAPHHESVGGYLIGWQVWA